MKVHKYAAMGKAKLGNMDLVLFIKIGGEWHKCPADYLPANECNEYYLCHPTHTKACEHWLNGGKALVDGITVPSLDHIHWSPTSAFMSPALTIKIAPKKEKRWVLVKPEGSTSYSYVTKEEALGVVNSNPEALDGYQLIEIEVEV